MSNTLSDTDNKIIKIIEELSHPRPGLNQKQLFDELNEEKDQNYEKYLLSLSSITLNEEISKNTRMLCVIQLKNSIYSSDKRKMASNSSKWLQIDQNARNKIFSNTFRLLHIKEFVKVAPLCLAHLCFMECQSNTWKELVNQLQNNVVSDQNDQLESNIILKCSSLTALGLISNVMYEYFDESIASTILSAVSYGLKHENSDAKKAAASTLYNVLDSIQDSIDNKQFRDEVLKLIIQINDKSIEDRIRTISFACLVKIADIYYNFLGEYIQGLFKITVDGMSDENQFIIMYSIEFWRIIAQKEYDLLELEKLTSTSSSTKTTAATNNNNNNTASSKQNDANNSEDASNKPLKNNDKYYSYHALPHIAMIILNHLEGNAGQNLEGWTPSSSATHLLNILSKCWSSEVLVYVGNFFSDQIEKEGWYCKNAAVMALGSILDGLMKDQIAGAMPRIWNYIIEFLFNSNDELRDTTCWVIGELTRVIPEYILQNCSQLIPQLTNLLKDKIKIAKAASTSLSNILEAFSKYRNERTQNNQNLTQFETIFAKPEDFISLIGMFIENTRRNDDSLAIISFSSISYVVIAVGSMSNMEEVGNFAFNTCLFNLEEAMKVSQSAIVSAILLTVHSIIEHFGYQNDQLCHHVMGIIEKIDVHMSDHKNDILSDIIALITLVISNLTEDSENYMNICIKILLNSVGDFQFDTETCKSSLNLLSILSTYCPIVFFKTISDQDLSSIINQLEQIVLSNLEEAFSIKSIVLDCYGDLMLSSNVKMFKHSESILRTVLMALSSEFDIANDVFQYKYAVDLYFSCMNTLCSLIHSFNNNTYPNSCQFIISVLPDITKYILRIANCLNNNENIQIALTGLIGDLSKYFPSEMVSCFKLISQQEISNIYGENTQNSAKGLNKILERAKFTDNQQLRNIYNYTAEQLKKANITTIIV